MEWLQKARFVLHMLRYNEHGLIFPQDEGLEEMAEMLQGRGLLRSELIGDGGPKTFFLTPEGVTFLDHINSLEVF